MVTFFKSDGSGFCQGFLHGPNRFFYDFCPGGISQTLECFGDFGVADGFGFSFGKPFGQSG